MAVRYLTVDLGNSQCKLRQWTEAGEAWSGARSAAVFESNQDLAQAVNAFLAETPAIQFAALSSVGAWDVEEALRDVLRHALGQGFREAVESGLDNRCRQPETVGCDRLFSARGALEVVGQSCIVVDAGTALTVDALEVGANGRGAFLGGAIAPGPKLLTDALATGGARLIRVDPKPGADALGRHTRAALNAGISVGLQGAARALVLGVAQEAGFEPNAPVVLCGGARAFLTAKDGFTDRPLREVPDLLQRGLLAALMDSCSSSKSGPR